MRVQPPIYLVRWLYGKVADFSRVMSRCIDHDTTKEIVDGIDNVLLDCDGVLWNGPEVIPGSPDVVAKLKKMGKRVFYVTNNSSKTRSDYAAKCQKFGFDATEEEIVCTAYIAAQYLKNIEFKGKIYVVGNASMGAELDKFDFNYLGIGPDNVSESKDMASYVSTKLDPDVNCVLIGFDPYLSYLKMLKGASYARREGTLFLATNEDSHLPIDSDIVIPGTGSIVAAVKIPARKEPIVVGKPEKVMFEALQKAHNLDPKRTMMVGDRCNTDVAMANNCGLKSLLVLSGVATMEDVNPQTSAQKSPLEIPTYYTGKFGDLMKFL